ncbi:hypothetical protein EK21DRAFT_44207, partial [Setomelanomma holmii]
MRLLNTFTLEVESPFYGTIPENVILPHTPGGEEVTLQDLQNGLADCKKGFAKLKGCCTKAKEDGYTYCWIDTCCIDQTSSAELSEAINLMYRCCQKSSICYIYLADATWAGHFEKAKWWSRGWTLQ